MRKKIQFAIAYDFDGTLAPGNMQEHSFIPGLGITIADFWSKVKRTARDNDMDEILSYMSLMLREASAREKKVTRDAFIEHGRSVPLFAGVPEWFRRITAYGKEQNVKVTHYIISSGLREMISGTSIAKEFAYIFASGYMYDQNGVAVWPALAVNYTNKTQHLFRINKGIENSYDNTTINKYVEESERPIPFPNMMYIGDGETDIPCMKMIKYQGGYAIAVFDPKKRKKKGQLSPKELCQQLIKQKRADFAVPADYTEGGSLDVLVKTAIDRAAATAKLSTMGK